MAKDKIKLKIITHAKVLLEKEVDAVYSESTDGSFGVLPGHVPYMAPLNIGVTKFVMDENADFVSTMGGIFQFKDNQAVILTDAAELGSEIDVTRANEAKQRAQARLGTSERDIDRERAEIALLRAMVRIKAASEHKHY